MGRPVIMMPNSDGCCFVDYKQKDSHEEPGQSYPKPFSRLYDFKPVSSGMTLEEAALVLGGRGNLWTKYVYLCALAETLWTPPANKDLDAFLRRLAVHNRRLENLAIFCTAVINSLFFGGPGPPGTCGTWRNSHKEMRNFTQFEAPSAKATWEFVRYIFCNKLQKYLILGAKPHKLLGETSPSRIASFQNVTMRKSNSCIDLDLKHTYLGFFMTFEPLSNFLPRLEVAHYSILCNTTTYAILGNIFNLRQGSSLISARQFDTMKPTKGGFA
jgi:hypothetical protein